MIGNSFKTDLAIAPLLSTSKLYSKNQSEVYMLNISYISKDMKKLKILRHGHKNFYSKSLALCEIHNMLGGLLAIQLHTRSEHTSLRLQKINVTSQYPQYVEQLVAKYAQQMPSTHNRWLPTHDRWPKHTLSVQNPIRLAKDKSSRNGLS